MTPHPWRTLRQLSHVDVMWHRLPHPYRSVTDGESIWMHAGLSQRERRSSLAHELIHIELGHTSCQPDSVEQLVRAKAARWLLPEITVVADALCFHGDDYDAAADDLWVDEATLWARLDPEHCPADERAYVARRMEEMA